MGNGEKNISNVTDDTNTATPFHVQEKEKKEDKSYLENIKSKLNIMMPKLKETGKMSADFVKEQVEKTKEATKKSLADEKNERTYSIFAYLPIIL